MTTQKLLEKWIDILNYWLDDIKELGERYDNMWHMYKKYDEMIDDMYRLLKTMEKQHMGE